MDKKYYIQTFGCQMNVHDSEQIAALLERDGYRSTDLAESADLIILNTCSIREKAEQKVHSQIGRFRDFKRNNPDLLIGIGGCLAQQWGEKFFKKAPHLDLIFGTHCIPRLPELIEKAKRNGKQIADISCPEKHAESSVRLVPARGQISTYVTIMRGCNNFCAYCVVPYLRGPEQSRELPDIVREVRSLAAQGIKEVTLLGQNVNSYGQTTPGKSDFPHLLTEIAQIEGINRIRFTTSHPKDLSPDLINCFSEIDKLCEHIHLPVQAGSDKVLQMMNRGYTKAGYLEKVDRLREICPDISITSDVIVGFPGEAEADFEETIDLMRKIRFDNLFSFKYSAREGTAAAKFDHQVSDSIKSARLRTLQLLQEQHTLEKNEAEVGKLLEVLVEGCSKNSPAELTGRTRTNKIVNFKGNTELIGQSLSILITYAYQHSLRGELTSDKEMDRC